MTFRIEGLVSEENAIVLRGCGRVQQDFMDRQAHRRGEVWAGWESGR
jgi:hypothetical protein